MGRIIVGTSGWSYQEWAGVFYPSSKESKLTFYTKVFSTAEIDSTFYAFPSQGMVLGWQRYSPKGFVFNAKMPQTVTHDNLESLGQPMEQEADRFAELMQPLNNAGKLGCILLQLPPRYKYNPSHLESFLSVLPQGFRYAIEFRNKSWMRNETWNTLSKYNVAYTIVDEPLLPPDLHITADFAYLRWHGRGQRPWYDYKYEMRELQEWVPRIKEVESSVNTTYGYFNNHFHGYAVENALEILQMLGKLTAAQEEALERAKNHLRALRHETVNLGEWTRGGDDRLKLVETLDMLMGESRLARAFAIADSEVQIRSASSQHVEARVREYTIMMDRPTRSIFHDCGDWARSIESRKLCKHVGKLLLTMSEDIALQWASSIQIELEEWRFLGPDQKDELR